MGKFKLLTILLFLFLTISCQKDESFIEPSGGLASLDVNDLGGAAGTRGDKVAICHNGHIINVNVNAVPSHQGHGDAVDLDGDGYFDLENVCTPGIDCDDNDPAVNPGAEEILGNGIDDDCNPATVEELVVYIDPDGTAESGDEYMLYVHPDDNSTGLEWGTLSVTQATAEFDGAANTEMIVNCLGAGDYAAKLCYNLTTNGHNWYLPAIGELNAMYQQLGPTNNGSGGSGHIPNGIYWSSTESNFVASFARNFNNSNLIEDIKYNTFRCRCVRK